MHQAAEEEGLPLTGLQVDTLAIHYRLLEIWSRRMNLTSIHTLDGIVARHFMEGLVAGEFLKERGFAGSVLDLGSGNGFPAVPIRVACPAVFPLILVESSRKRAGFLR